jgi:hypothetical protein
VQLRLVWHAPYICGVDLRENELKIASKSSLYQSPVNPKSNPKIDMKTMTLSQLMKCFYLWLLISTACLNQTQAAYLGPIPDDVLYTNTLSGSYGSFLSPWNSAALPVGGSYSEFLVYDPTNYPNNQQIYWSWPSIPPTTAPGGVYNFLAIDFGNYYGTIVPTPIMPQKLGTITHLSQAFNLTLVGDTNGYDVLIDFFTTLAPNNFSNRQHEIEIFLHTPSYAAAYVQSVTQIGTYTDSNGRAWTCAIDKNASPHDILFMPTNKADILSGTVDIRGMLNWLVGMAWCSSAEYFNGLGFGLEVNHGTGSISVNSLSTTYN